MKSCRAVLIGCVVLLAASGGGCRPLRSGDDEVLRSERGATVEIASPHVGAVISSPVKIAGEVPGSWSFEANFGVEVLDSDRKSVATGYATVNGDWMTSERVRFTASVPFRRPESRTGFLVIRKANPSDREGTADSVEIPIRFRQ